MAVLTRFKVPAGHWYAADGTPVHRQPTADGSRPTTLRDARRMGLYPSVTSVLGVLAKPGLETWKLNRVALATLRCPKGEEEGDDYWCRRVRDAAFEEVEQAADLGSSIHEALEAATADEPYNDDLRRYVQPVLEWKESTGIVYVDRELPIVSKRYGFAGTADVLFRYGQMGIGILDYKTRKTEAGKKVTPYDGQAMQLAAYAAAYWGEENLPRVLAANVYISTTEPGRMEVCKHDNLVAHFEAFKQVCELWRYLKAYDPRDVS